MAKPSSRITSIAIPVPKETAPEHAYLLVIAGPQMGAMFRVELNRELVIGRDDDVDIALTDESVSRRHASIGTQGTSVRLRDLGSRNGTFVAGKPVTDQLLLDGDKIQVGGTTLKFAFTDHMEVEYQQRL